jgi:hypothetical protein
VILRDFRECIHGDYEKNMKNDNYFFITITRMSAYSYIYYHSRRALSEHNNKVIRDQLGNINGNGAIIDRILLAKNQYNWTLSLNKIIDILNDETNPASEMLLNVLAKDPRRQNLAEKCQLAYLNLFFPDIEKVNNVYIDSGSVISSGKKMSFTCKSIDFKEDSEDTTRYFACKHTTICGGSQDHQRNDLVKFISEFKRRALVNSPDAEKEEYYIVYSGNHYNPRIRDEIESEIDYHPSIHSLCLDKPLSAMYVEKKRIKLMAKIARKNAKDGVVIDATFLDLDKFLEFYQRFSEKPYVVVELLKSERKYVRIRFRSGCILSSIPKKDLNLTDADIEQFGKGSITAIYF